MKFAFDASEELIYEFEALLKSQSLVIEKDSDLEQVLLAVLEVNAKNKKEIAHNNEIDIRDLFSDQVGIVDFASKIVKHKYHKDFQQLIPHLRLLNSSNTSTLTKKSRVTDSGNNKLLELYIALLCMSFADDVFLDDPDESKGDNPDVMFTYKGMKWAIACKALHTTNEKSLFDTIEKGTDQINKSDAHFGIVLVNFKNIIDRDEIWPMYYLSEAKGDNAPEFGTFPTTDTPTKKLANYGNVYLKKLQDTIGQENLIKLSSSGKCPPGFLIFLQAVTGVLVNGLPTATLLKTFNCIQFDSFPNRYVEIAENLNKAMHDII